MTTSGGTCGCGGPAYSHKWKKAPTFWSSDSSERERQIYGLISTFPIWLWKIRLWHTTLYVLSLTPHLIKHWYHNHQFELAAEAATYASRILVFLCRTQPVSRFKQATKLTIFSIITFWVTGQIYFTKEHFKFIYLILNHFLPCMCLRIFFYNSKYFIRHLTQFEIICINSSLLDTDTLLFTKVKYKR